MRSTTAYQPPQLGRKGCFGVGVLGCILCICLLLDTCVSRVVVTQVHSPDGSLVASVTETNGGATTDFSYEVAIARNSPLRWSYSVAGLYGAGRSDCTYGVNLRWIGNDALVITYKNAKSADADKAAYLLGRTVRVITKAGVNDPAAPCGGMEYSQHAR